MTWYANCTYTHTRTHVSCNAAANFVHPFSALSIIPPAANQRNESTPRRDPGSVTWYKNRTYTHALRRRELDPYRTALT